MIGAYRHLALGRAEMSKQWAKSTNGPDLMDVETMMRALSGLHSGIVSITLSPRGLGSSGGVVTSAQIALSVLPGSSLPEVIGATSEWPCKKCGSFWGHIYGLLYELDQEVGKVYKQETLWK
jgi:hypothetical protein